jgi:hypothetical protein
VDLAQDGKRWSATFFFPRTGEYDLSLYGKRRSDGTSARIGRVRLWAAVSASAAPAEGWTLSPRFRKYGFDIVSTSPADVEDEASAVISVPEGYDAELAFSDAASGQPVKTVSTFAEGPNRGMMAIFPESGQYELAILGGKKGAARLPEVARVTFVSAIDPSLPRFRLWQMENDWPKIPLESVSAVSGDWKPFDDLSLWRSHVRGLLAHQFVLPVGEQSLVLRRGSSVELAADDAFLAEVISFVLPSDLSAKAGTATVTFKAGSAFTFRPGDAAGVLARDTALFVEGNALYCPRGSRLLLHGSEPRQVDLSGSGTFAAAGKIYACSGSVIITPLSDGRSTLKISTAKPIALQFGSTKFVLPAGSQMVFRDGVLDYLVFARDFSLPLRTERRRIPAGWAARFDVQGAVEITKPE